MREVKVKDLKNHQIMAKAVVNDKGSILLYDGAVIKTEHIKKLMENHIEYVYIRDAAKQVDTVSVMEIKKDSVEQIQKAIEYRINNKDDSEIKIITQTAVDIISEIIEHPQITECMLSIKREKNDVYTHMLSVSALSTIMAIKAGFCEQEVKNVATGALLHDVGLAKVEIPYNNIEVDALPAADKLNYRRHVIAGYEFVKDFKWMSEDAKMIILSHHERSDGSGYPFHKKSDRISKEVSLVAICDHFDEMINGIGYKKRKTHEVIEYLRTNEAYDYDYEMMTMVMQSVAWFPTGSLIITNEGEIGEVIAQNSGLPDRPIIKILKDADGKACKKNTVKDLTELLTVFIIETIEKQEEI